MFCPKCGTELMEGSSFCPECGAKVEVEEAASATVENSEKPATEDGLGAKNGQRVLRREVRFAKNLQEPVTDIPPVEPTGNELGDELTLFANIYETSVVNYKALLETLRMKKLLEESGYQWYYSFADDPVIEASRQINAEIADTEQLLRETRAQIAQNEQARLKAAQRRDTDKQKSQKSADRTKKWTGVKGGCMKIVVGYFAVCILALFFVPGLLNNPGTVVTLIGSIALIAVFYVWYSKKSKKKVMNAQKTADAKSRTADERFSQTLAELAKKDADLSAQCVQIEGKISELTPIAGEIRHKANERSKFLFSTEMLELDELLQRLAKAAITQTNTLKEMGTIPDQDEWFESRHIAKIVVSGRADTLKEALQLLDTANYREADLTLKSNMVEAQSMTNTILATGFTQVVANQQQTLAEMRAGFDAVIEQQEVQHAQQMAMSAKQAKNQAELIKQQAEGNKLTTEGNQAIREGNQAQSDFYQEVRDRFNWTDANRPRR